MPKWGCCWYIQGFGVLSTKITGKTGENGYWMSGWSQRNAALRNRRIPSITPSFLVSFPAPLLFALLIKCNENDSLGILPDIRSPLNSCRKNFLSRHCQWLQILQYFKRDLQRRVSIGCMEALECAIGGNVRHQHSTPVHERCPRTSWVAVTSDWITV